MTHLIYLTGNAANKGDKIYWSRSSTGTSEWITGPEMNTPDKTRHNGIKPIRFIRNKRVTLLVEIPCLVFLLVLCFF